MPVQHNFECTKGHITLKIMPSVYPVPRKRCGFEGCKALAERILLPRRYAHCEPTIVFRAADGHIEFPGHRDHPTPKGYDRVEIPSHEIRAFERQMNREIAAKETRLSEMDQRVAEHVCAQRHADLRAELSQMDTFHRELAIESMKGESAGYSKTYDPGFHIGAYS
jgi:hypothetical protein